MSHSNTNTPLGCTGQFPLDHAQSKRKTYDKRINAHRTLEVAEPWNKVSYEYNSAGQILTETYIWEETAEITNVTTVSDCAKSLDGTAIGLFTKDGHQFRGYYIVDCTSTIPTDGTSITFIPINLVQNDDASVVALATKLAYENNSLAMECFTVDVVDNLLTFTHLKKGSTIDIVNIGTGFTVETSTQGVTNTVEVITYEYNTDGSIKSITNSSNENITGFEGSSNVFSITGGGNVANITENGELKTKSSQEERCFLMAIEDQLKKLNLQMSYMTGIEHEIDGK